MKSVFCFTFVFLVLPCLTLMRHWSSVSQNSKQSLFLLVATSMSGLSKCIYNLSPLQCFISIDETFFFHSCNATSLFPLVLFVLVAFIHYPLASPNKLDYTRKCCRVCLMFTKMWIWIWMWIWIEHEPHQNVERKALYNGIFYGLGMIFTLLNYSVIGI